MHKQFTFDELDESDLVVDALYKGGSAGNVSDDPIHKLVGGGNQGGFRFEGSSDNLECAFVVLYSSLSDPDWPDYLDVQTGQFTYFGDNKRPGHLLHETHRQGNVILRDSFDATHNGRREDVPPFFIFVKAGSGRDVIFKGLAAPGSPDLGQTDDLVAVWKSKEGQRFQNYKAIFTVLDVPVVSREWIEDIKRGETFSENCPDAWKEWVEHGRYSALRATKSIEYRDKSEQIPNNDNDRQIIELVHSYFEDDPHEFEKCAAEIVQIMDKNVVSYDVTRPWADGGRDALGKYRIGLEENPILVEFAIEAKCYGLDNGVGVNGTTRLISRLRYRQFGVLVTTSYVSKQAYKEIKEDQHPVIIISARDIVNILKRGGYNTFSSVQRWLESNFDKE